MAEPIALVGLLASVATLSTLCKDFITRFKELRSNFGEVPSFFHDIEGEIEGLVKVLARWNESVESQGRDEGLKALFGERAERCTKEIKNLEDIITRAAIRPDDSGLMRLKKTLASLKDDAKVKRTLSRIRQFANELHRLQSAVNPSTAKHSYDHQPRVTPCSTVPFPQDKKFIDSGILQTIDSKLQEHGSRVALYGLGGVGKSQIAIEYSYRIQQKTPKTWVFWIHAGSSTRFENGYRAIADRVEITGREDPKADLVTLVREWLRQSKDPWLLIIDNFDDPGALRYYGRSSKLCDRVTGLTSPEGDGLRAYLPTCGNGTILVTSRHREAEFLVTGDYNSIIHVDPMDQPQAVNLLKCKLETDMPYDEEDVAQLVKELDFMPLAIAQAAAYINERYPLAKVSTYLHKLRNGGDHVRARLLQEGFQDGRRDEEKSSSIIRTWHISFEYIREERQSAAELLSFMCLFDRQSIPKSFLIGLYTDKCTACNARSDSNYTGTAFRRAIEEDNACLESEDDSMDSDFTDDGSIRSDSFSFTSKTTGVNDEKDHDFERELTNNWGHGRKAHAVISRTWTDEMTLAFEEDWKLLKGLSFVNTSLDGTSFSMHRLVQLSTVKWLEQKDQLERWKTEYVCHMDRLFPTWEQGVSRSQSRKKFERVSPHLQVAFEYTPNDFDVYKRNLWLQFLNGIAGDASRIECEFIARDIYRMLSEFMEHEFGKEDPATLRTLCRLGKTLRYCGQSEAEESVRILRLVVHRHERTLGQGHIETLFALHNLAMTFSRLEKFDEAEPIHRKVLEEARRLPEWQHDGMKLPFLWGLITCILDKSDFDLEYKKTLIEDGKVVRDTEDMLKEALEASMRFYGPDDHRILFFMEELVFFQTMVSQYTEAEELAKSAISKAQQICGEDDVLTYAQIHWYAAVLLVQGKTEEADNLFRCHWQLAKEVLDRKGSTYLRLLGQLAVLTEIGKRDEEALVLYEEAAIGIQSLYGSQNWLTRECISGAKRTAARLKMRRSSLRHVLPNFGNALFWPGMEEIFLSEKWTTRSFLYAYLRQSVLRLN